MESQRITITIDASTGVLSGTEIDNYISKPRPKPKRKSIGGSPGVDDSRGAILPGAALVNQRTVQAVGEVAAIQNKLPRKCGNVVTVVQRSRSPIRSPMPTLPYPPKHMINSNWKKVPLIPKLTVITGPGMIQLTWDDGISLGSYHQYAAIAGQELFACVFDGETNHVDVKWEKLAFIKAEQPCYSRRLPIVCEMTDMATGVEYYFAVRQVDVHDRRGPCAVVYARL